jgi:hypothetical protein
MIAERRLLFPRTFGALTPALAPFEMAASKESAVRFRRRQADFGSPTSITG